MKDTKPKNNKLSSSSTNVIENSNKQHEKLTQQLQARDSELPALKNQLKNAQDKVLQLTSDNVNLVQKLSKFVKEEQNEDNHFVPEKCSSYKEIFET